MLEIYKSKNESYIAERYIFRKQTKNTHCEEV